MFLSLSNMFLFLYDMFLIISDMFLFLYDMFSSFDVDDIAKKLGCGLCAAEISTPSCLSYGISMFDFPLDTL